MKFPDSPVALLQELVRIPSVNPDSAPDESAAGESACAAWVGEFLRRCGAGVVLEAVLPGRPNVIGRFPGPQDRRGILLAPHTDTVSVAGMTVAPFGGELREGRVYGRGASDTKGTMASMLWALHLLREELPALSRPVAFVGLMGEEAGQPGAKHFAAHHADEFEFAVVGEPTSLETVYATKGCVWLELSAVGRSCHGSTPELGENAARKMVEVLAGLLPALEAALPGYADEALGAPTVNLGGLAGGSSPNIVPASCRAVLDFRETPALHRAGGGEALVREILEGLGREDAVACRVLGAAAPLLNDPEIDGIRRLRALGSPLASAPWYCDAGRLAEKGLASVACGPGSIAQAHTKDEFLAVDDLEAGVDFYARFLRSYAQG